MRYRRFLFAAAAIFLQHFAMSQAAMPGTVSNDSSFYTLLSVFQNDAAEQLHLYNGNIYLPKGNGIKGSPFLSEGGFTDGNIVFEGKRYMHIMLQYDLVSDEIVVRGSVNNDISLIKEKTTAFETMGRRFVRLIPDSTNSLSEEHFYELLYDGPVKVWARRWKKTEYNVTSEGTVYRFVQYDNYYVEKEHRFFSVEGERSLLSVLKDKRPLLKKYKAEAGIKFGKDPGNAIVQLVQYYTQIKK